MPDELLKEQLPAADDRAAHEGEMRRLLHVAMTRARKGLVLAWAETGRAGRHAAAVALLRGGARGGRRLEEEVLEEELFGPAEGLHSTFRMMRDELLDTVARVGGRLGEMRLDTYLDVDQAVSRYLELIKVAALIERAKRRPDARRPRCRGERDPRPVRHARAARGPRAVRARRLAARRRAATRRAAGGAPRTAPSRRSTRSSRAAADGADAVGLRHRHLPALPAEVQVRARLPDPPGADDQPALRDRRCTRCWSASTTRAAAGSLEHLMELFEASWRRSGFGDSDDELQFRERAVAALRALLGARPPVARREPVWFERSFAFKIGPHLLRGRVDRVDRLPTAATS